jgi:phage tail-like protein
MPSFSVNANRFDPYKNFKFRVKWDNRYVAGVHKVSGLRRTTEVIEHREGGDPNVSRRSPGRTAFAPIVLERGLTHDTAFEEWAGKVWTASAQDVSLADFRKDVLIDVFNEAGQKVLSYKVHRCWVSEYEAFADLDANAGGHALERLTLVHEGFERDLAVKEPKETGRG